jgi:hypothetical protein
MVDAFSYYNLVAVVVFVIFVDIIITGQSLRSKARNAFSSDA